MTMSKTAAVLIALVVGNFTTLFWTAKAGRGESKEPEHVALQTRQDIGSIYACLSITNGLLAAILVALLY